MLYVKDRHTFATIKQSAVLKLDPLVYDATEDTTSNITVEPGGLTSDDIDNWAVFDDEEGVWVIKGITPQDESLTVSLEPVWRIFSRDHIYSDAEYASKGAFITAIIQSEYIEQSDPFYAYPYMSITNSYIVDDDYKAPAEDGEIYSLSDYIETAIKVNDLGFRVSFSRTSLAVTLVKHSGATDTVVFNDGHNLYESASFGEGGVAKVTVIQNGSTTDYYMNANGDIVTTTPSPRVNGEWKMISIGDDDDPITEVEEEFKDAINSYKIEWGSDRVFSMGDTIRFQLTDGSVHYGKVTYKSKKTSDGLYHYKAGSLKTTLTDKLRSVK